jgi:outer membrane protein assembly factor BamA
MRLKVPVALVLALGTTPLITQIAAGIHLADVRFSGDTRLKGVDLNESAADLRSGAYEGPGWLDGLAERVRRFLQDDGYFKAAVTPSAQQLSDRDETHQFIVTFHIEAGQQYRTGEIVFKNNHLFSSGELRSMLGLKSGDVFSAKTIRQGLDQMHSAYASHQHPNFASVPDTNIHDSKGVIDLIIDCDEGKQLR